VTIAGRWITEAHRILRHIDGTQMEALSRVAEMCAGTIGSGGLVHLFGSGHSRIPVEEMFPRYGSFPGFLPMAELSMTFHTEIVGTNGQRQAMFIEQVPGLAEAILSNFHFGPHDMMIVFSASGRSAVPVEIAAGARRRGLPVVAVTSLEETMALPPSHPDGRLLDQADVVIDLGTPKGDAMIPLEGLESKVGPGSTVAYVAIVNEIKVQTAARLHEMGRLPAVLASRSTVGPDRAAQLFDEAFADHAGRLARVIAGSP
jgi:uncharacterized phosphosugar-binding protein